MVRERERDLCASTDGPLQCTSLACACSLPNAPLALPTKKTAGRSPLAPLKNTDPTTPLPKEDFKDNALERAQEEVRERVESMYVSGYRELHPTWKWVPRGESVKRSVEVNGGSRASYSFHGITILGGIVASGTKNGSWASNGYRAETMDLAFDLLPITDGVVKAVCRVPKYQGVRSGLPT